MCTLVRGLSWLNAIVPHDQIGIQILCELANWIYNTDSDAHKNRKFLPNLILSTKKFVDEAEDGEKMIKISFCLRQKKTMISF